MSHSLDIVLENGRALLFDSGLSDLVDAEVNIGISNGKIAVISNSNLGPAAQRIDCKNLYILPGVIDSQVHFRDPGLTHKEDFESGTMGAALGGVTCVFDMPNTKPSTTTKELLLEKIEAVKSKSWVDFGCFIGASPENIFELKDLESISGCPGIKIFMGSSTGNLLVEEDEHLEKILLHSRRRVIVHCEDEKRLRERKSIAVEGASPLFHPQWRDEETAYLATQRLLKLARKTNRKVHVLHVTTSKEMDLLAQNKDIASVEVLPQHLTLSSPQCYEQLGTKAQMNPPIRELKHQEALWRALKNKIVDVIGSDHAPHTIEEKNKIYPESPSGMTGVQTLVPIMLNHVNQGKLGLKDFARLVCENPRWVFGCWDRGRIQVGLGAHFTIVDMNRKETIRNQWIKSRCGWSPFDGMSVQGWPVMTIVNGNIVARDNQLIAKAGKIAKFE